MNIRLEDLVNMEDDKDIYISREFLFFQLLRCQKSHRMKKEESLILDVINSNCNNESYCKVGVSDAKMIMYPWISKKRKDKLSDSIMIDFCNNKGSMKKLRKKKK